MPTYIVNTGIAVAMNRIKGLGTEPVFASWGTTNPGTTVKTETTLAGEIANASGTRVTGTSSIQTSGGGSANDTYQVVALLTVAAGSSVTVTNAGLLDAVSAGNLFLKGDFTGVALNVADSIQFTFKVVGSSS